MQSHIRKVRNDFQHLSFEFRVLQLVFRKSQYQFKNVQFELYYSQKKGYYSLTNINRFQTWFESKWLRSVKSQTETSVTWPGSNRSGGKILLIYIITSVTLALDA